MGAEVSLALQDDPALQSYRPVEMIKNHLPDFADTVEDIVLNQQVTLRGLLVMRARLFESVLKTDFGNSQCARGVRVCLQSQVDYLWDQVETHGECMDEHEKYF